MNKNLVLNKQLTETDYTDKRRKTALVLDVETTLAESNEQVVFDIGYTISEVGNEKMVIHRNYLVEEIFLDMEMMARAYYFKKFPRYIKALAEQRVELKPFNEIIKILKDDIRKYNVRNLYAYNAKFDSSALEATDKFINGKAIRTEFNFTCLWSLSAQTYMGTQKYVRTAFEKGWLTEKGNIKTSAEIAYRYLTGNDEFIEAHTGLEDSVIETKILWRINRYGKKQNKKCRKQPWRKVKKIKDNMGL